MQRWRLVVAWCCFFFQAEDGIRDAQESRGLGDVYKRQAIYTIINDELVILVLNIDSRGDAYKKGIR